MQKAAAKATLSANGPLTVASGAWENGTSTYIIRTRIAVETLSLPLEAVTLKLGDTTLPKAPLQGGSWTAASVGMAVKNTCETLGEKLLKLAQKMTDFPLKNATFEDRKFVNGQLRLRLESTQAVVMRNSLQGSGSWKLRPRSCPT
ncbi:molybdopterin-dependent oxidoreductase [Hymenobacter sp. BT175]|uniref:molybdopterin cofactor-binding domain-containing protein n=1 Tax=Hymenobacter translucens TaxID=2886507 RepID=UPI001D0DEF25|nr:molybdopterin cofactor-binding domain-containing protein [Hymenobacter translucens]MCC2546518.1 molybdopterin-dependent oxidoreductase [Hymenobacter translucens]